MPFFWIRFFSMFGVFRNPFWVSKPLRTPHPQTLAFRLYFKTAKRRFQDAFGAHFGAHFGPRGLDFRRFLSIFLIDFGMKTESCRLY